ncbi:MAG: amino acid adenylation domain-containing protein, partial [Candidatus Aminicenantes bacterium]
PERTLSYTPLFQVLFSFMDTPTEYLSLPGLEVNAEPTHNRSSKFDLNIVVLPPPEELVEEIGSQIYIEWEYNTDIFDQSTMDRMIHHYLRLLELAPQHPEEPIYSLPMLAEAEIHQLVYEWNHTAAQYPKHKTIHELFAEQVEQTPDNIAVVGAHELHELHQKGTRGLAPLYITYKELNQQANQLVYLLIEKGVHHDTIVGIMMERSIGKIVGILAILKAGGAYMPIDPDYPQERIRYMISDSRVNMLLTTPHLSCKWEKLSIVNCQLLIVNQKHPAGPGLNNPVQEPDSINNDGLTINHSQLKQATLAYVLYTSGTTGRPKGVMIEHSNVVNLLTWYGKTYNLGKDTRVLQLTNYTFDPSVEDIFGTLLYGAVLYIGSPELAFNRELFGKYVEKHQVNLVDFVPTLLNELLGSRQQPRTLETVISGGETLTDTVKQKIIEKGYPLYNHYGPTETTVDAMAEKCSTDSVTIGYPISNVTCYILDNHQHPLPLGVIGELYISGAGLGRGYMNNPGLTAQKFIKNPFSPGKRMFRTGDLARRLPTGKIQFLGRQDQQVKIRGHRIELKEIENCLLKHPHIKKAIVIDNKNGKGETHLYAYVVPGKKGSPLELREYLSKYLPAYMMPAYFVQIEKLPLTSNGKIDRKSLPLPPLKNEKNYTAPVDEAEEKLAAIWSEVLQIEKDIISTTDNFFGLGGHSLNATMVISTIRKEFNIDVPLLELFKRPTIKSLAKYTRTAKKRKRILTAQDDQLVLLKQAGSKNKNLFLVHDVTGEVDVYIEFSNHLEIQFNCWGIRADRFDNYGPGHISIDEIAPTYIEKIKKIQGHGPYYLAGWSIGGTIAFEILRQLENINEIVIFFALIDSMPPRENLQPGPPAFSVQSELESLWEFLGNEENRKKAGKAENLEQFWHFVVNLLEESNHYPGIESIKRQVPKNIQQEIPNFNQLTLKQMVYYFNVSRTLARACDRYIPGGKVKTPIHFFTARRSKIKNKNDWQKYSHHPLKFHKIAGDHFSILKMPQAASFAKLFENLMQNPE